MEGTLHRFAYTPEDTQGRMVFGDWWCWTIEQPWVRWSFPGGKPFASCIPDGVYDMVPFLRPSGEKSFVLINERLGVYFHKADRVDGNGRYLCSVHKANYADDVEGCIGPGRRRLIHKLRARLMVTDSEDTMRELIDAIGWVDGHTLRIECATGAIDTPLRLP